MPAENPIAAIVVREYRGQPYYEAKFRYQGRQVKRRIGPAWLESDPQAGGWRRRRGRVPEDAYDERRAHVAAAQIVAEYVEQAADLERVERERRQQGASFREVALAYLNWLENVRGAKPATLQDHRSVLGEPGVPYKRGKGTTAGHVMAALGDRPAAQITTREIESLLTKISDHAIGGQEGDRDESVRKVAPRTVNKYRAVINAVFNYGCKPSTFALPSNPADLSPRVVIRTTNRSYSTSKRKPQSTSKRTGTSPERAAYHVKAPYTMALAACCIAKRVESRSRSNAIPPASAPDLGPYCHCPQTDDMRRIRFGPLSVVLCKIRAARGRLRALPLTAEQRPTPILHS
jgi:hypothetical protein